MIPIFAKSPHNSKRFMQNKSKGFMIIRALISTCNVSNLERLGSIKLSYGSRTTPLSFHNLLWFLFKNVPDHKTKQECSAL